MTSASKPQAFALLFRVKVALICSAPLLAAAADATVQHVARKGSIEAVSAWTWMFLIGFAMLGWCVSELDKLAELWALEGKTPREAWLERFKLIKGVAAANAAGIVAYFLGDLAPGILIRMIGLEAQGEIHLPEMVLFVFVCGAGYMGPRLFAAMERKFFQAGT